MEPYRYRYGAIRLSLVAQSGLKPDAFPQLAQAAQIDIHCQQLRG